MTLTVDPSAPTGLSDELSKKLANSKRVVRLSSKSKRLTAKIRAKYGPVKNAPREDPWVKKKKDVDAALHRERTNRRSRMVDKARKRHFRNADTDTLEAQFADTAISASAKDAELTRPLKYNIPERDVVIRLTCEPVTDLTDREKHVRSIEAIKARAALCRRQESQRRGRPRSTFKPKELMNSSEGLAKDSEEDTTDYFPLICRPTQCPFCLGEERKSYEDRTFEYCRPNKMMEHVHKAHLRKYASNDEIDLHTQ